MRNGSLLLLLLLVTLAFITTACKDPDTHTADDLVVLKRVGEQNKYESYKRITEPELVRQVSRMLREGEWEKVKFKQIKMPDYQLLFQPTDGREVKPVLYQVSFSSGYAEIYITAENSFKKLSKEDSAVLLDALQ